MNPDDFARNFSGQGCTDADGRYEGVPVGDAPAATLWFQDVREVPVYAAEFAGAYDVSGAQPIDLSGDDVVVDTTLAVGGVLTGKAVSERKPNGLADVCPSAYAGHTGAQLWGAARPVRQMGVYRLTALPPGDTALLLQPSWCTGVSDEWYQDADSQATAQLCSGVPRLHHDPEGAVPPGRRHRPRPVTDASGQPGVEADVYLRAQTNCAGPVSGPFVAETDARPLHHGRPGRHLHAVRRRSLGRRPRARVVRRRRHPGNGRSRGRARLPHHVVRRRPRARFSHHRHGRQRRRGRPRPPTSTSPGSSSPSPGDYIGDLDAWADNGFRFFGSNLPVGPSA